MPEPSDLLTYAESADIASVSVSQVKKWAQAREFPVFDGGHRTKRIKRADLLAFLDARTWPARPKTRRPRSAA